MNILKMGIKNNPTSDKCTSSYIEKSIWHMAYGIWNTVFDTSSAGAVIHTYIPYHTEIIPGITAKNSRHASSEPRNSPRTASVSYYDVIARLDPDLWNNSVAAVNEVDAFFQRFCQVFGYLFWGPTLYGLATSGLNNTKEAVYFMYFSPQ